MTTHNEIIFKALTHRFTHYKLRSALNRPTSTLELTSIKHCVIHLTEADLHT